MTAQSGGHEVTHHDHSNEHPEPRLYVQIGVILSLLTAGEVSLFYIDVGGAFIPAMLILMSIKFVMVVGYFMHLKYDTVLFRRLLVTGLALAVAVYTIVIGTFGGFLN